MLELYSEFGLPTQEIADVLGKSRNSIDIHLTFLRKAGKIGKKEAPEAELQEYQPVAAVAVQPM